MTTFAGRFAHLPDIDNTGIEVYETPELTDDASTLRDTETNRSRSQSETSETPNDSFDKTRIDADSARTQFLPSRVDARDVDFSDRLSERRRTYKSTTRVRRRDRGVITAEDEDDNVWSDDDAGEALARKLARLTREVEEVKTEYARQQRSTETDTNHEDAESVIDSLGKALDSLRVSQREAVSAHSRMAKHLSKPTAAKSQETDPQPSLPQSGPEQVDDHLMAQLAAFESRLTDLERGLGLATLDTTSNYAPLIHTLATLDAQVSFLTSPDAKSHLETLAAEIAAEQPPAAASASTNTVLPAQHTEDPSVAQLQSLVALLPTLTAQSEIVPHLLTRLSTLRHIHSGAESASTSLGDLETRQRETEGEIKVWRDGLEKVRDAITAAESGLKVNVDTVEEWVRALEEKVKAVLTI